VHHAVSQIWDVSCLFLKFSSAVTAKSGWQFPILGNHLEQLREGSGADRSNTDAAPFREFPIAQDPHLVLLT
jgi:hypothetical protein